jgi:DNA modification methylase
MKLLARVINYMKLRGNTEVVLKELYECFPRVKASTIRGRVNEAVGTSILRTTRGKYVLMNKEIQAIVEQDDSKIVVPFILQARLRYDMIFLDIPYNTSGQKAGNRNLSDYALVEVEEFNSILAKLQHCLKDETSQVYFMISGGKSSKREAAKYLEAFSNTELSLAGKGYYQKYNKNGSICNMGKYQMPPEEIYVFSKCGELKKENTMLDFDLERPSLPRQGGYPTEKPSKMISAVIEQSTKKGDIILDLFSGSGVMLDTCLKMGRKIHAIDIADESIGRIMKILKQYVTIPKLPTMRAANNIYSANQLQAFASGVLF